MKTGRDVKPLVDFGFPEEKMYEYTNGGCWFLAKDFGSLCSRGYRTIMVGQETYHVGVSLPNGYVVDIEGIWTEEQWEARWWESSSTNYPRVDDPDEDVFFVMNHEKSASFFPDSMMIAKAIFEQISATYFEKENHVNSGHSYGQ